MFAPWVVESGHLGAFVMTRVRLDEYHNHNPVTDREEEGEGGYGCLPFRAPRG